VDVWEQLSIVKYHGCDGQTEVIPDEDQICKINVNHDTCLYMKCATNIGKLNIRHQYAAINILRLVIPQLEGHA